MRRKMKLTLWKNSTGKMFFVAMIVSVVAAVSVCSGLTSVSKDLDLWFGVWGYIVAIKLMFDAIVFWFFWFLNLFYS